MAPSPAAAFCYRQRSGLGPPFLRMLRGGSVQGVVGVGEVEVIPGSRLYDEMEMAA